MKKGAIIWFLLKLKRKGIESDPLDYRKRYQLALYLYWNGQLEEARQSIKEVEGAYPDRAILHHLRSRILLGQPSLTLVSSSA